MQDFTNIPAVLTSGWTEDDPTVSGVYFAIDEYDPNNPAVQILTEVIDSEKEWLINTIYRTNQRARLTVFLNPIYYDPAYLVTAKETFYNTLNEVDRILESMRYLYVAEEYDFYGWTVQIPKGFGGQSEPLTLRAEQIVRVKHYG